MPGIALLALVSIAGFSCATQPSAAAPSGDAAPKGVPAAGGLRALADGMKLSLGAAVMPDYLAEPAYKAALVANYNYISPENDLKWESVHPARDAYDFKRGDELADFARANGMAFRGHTLVWHSQNPAWLTEGKFSGAELEAILKDHIMTVAGHYKGKVRDWDVVNEAIAENGRLRDTIWLEGMGEDYIAKAFRWARAADPGARLFINDYGAEALGSKSDALYALVKGLLAAGVPIDGVGFQFHLVGQADLSLKSVAKNLARFKALGLQVQVTELDVRLPAPPSAKDLAAQADLVAGLARLCLAYDASALVFWGVGDAHSWIPGQFEGYGSGLLLDAAYARKPCAESLAAVLAGPRPGADYLAGIMASEAFVRVLPPYRCARADVAPTVDGKVDAGEWDAAYAYPLLYNQLQPDFQVLPLSEADCSGVLRILFKGDTMYGYLKRADDVTVTEKSDPWENDNFELFYRIGDDWKQIRTVVGEGWQKDNLVDGRAVWSEDGAVLEFSVRFPGGPVDGKTFGFNAALSDRDDPAAGSRKGQYYLVAGNNTGWQGKGFGEVTFEDARGAYVAGDPVGDPKPFVAHPLAGDAPVVDGVEDDACWMGAARYSLGYAASSSRDMSPPPRAELYGEWSLLADGGTVYGFITRTDRDTWTGGKVPSDNDGVLVSLRVYDAATEFFVVAGKDLDAAAGKASVKARWNADASVCEFAIDFPGEELAGRSVEFRLGLSDWDAGKFKRLLLPFPSFAFQPAAGAGLGAEMSAAASETAILKVE